MVTPSGVSSTAVVKLTTACRVVLFIVGDAPLHVDRHPCSPWHLGGSIAPHYATPDTVFQMVRFAVIVHRVLTLVMPAGTPRQRADNRHLEQQNWVCQSPPKNPPEFLWLPGR
jgi:hypothetical protein